MCVCVYIYIYIYTHTLHESVCVYIYIYIGLIKSYKANRIMKLVLKCRKFISLENYMLPNFSSHHLVLYIFPKCSVHFFILIIIEISGLFFNPIAYSNSKFGICWKMLIFQWLFNFVNNQKSHGSKLRLDGGCATKANFRLLIIYKKKISFVIIFCWCIIWVVTLYSFHISMNFN